MGWWALLGKFGIIIIMWVVVIVLVDNVNGGCLEGERRGLLEIKKFFKTKGGADVVDQFLSNWVEKPAPSYHHHHHHQGGGECCNWERVTCNRTTGHVTKLSLGDILHYGALKTSINASLFLPFKELRSLNLSRNSFSGWTHNEGLERLSNLTKLETLDLGYNYFHDDHAFRSLSALASLNTLILRDNSLRGNFTTAQGFEWLSNLTKLEILDLGYNLIDNSNIFRSLGALPSIKTLLLDYNSLGGYFPAHELVPFRNLEKLDISYNSYNGCLPMPAVSAFQASTAASATDHIAATGTAASATDNTAATGTAAT